MTKEILMIIKAIRCSAAQLRENLRLSDSGKIGFAIQTDTILPNMQIFKGQLQLENINWISPSPLLNDTIFRFAVVKPWNQDEITRDEAIKRGIIITGTLTGDRIFEDVEFVFPEPDTSETEEFNEPIAFFDMSGNSNAFLEDINQKYVFELFNLGWANIDRLLDDERTEFVDLTTSISNYQEFGQVYITMVFTSKSIYLPGYQKKDMTFSFTHGDYEETRLPIGEDAIIIATSSKKGIPYIDIKLHAIWGLNTLCCLFLAFQGNYGLPGLCILQAACFLWVYPNHQGIPVPFGQNSRLLLSRRQSIKFGPFRQTGGILSYIAGNLVFGSHGSC